MGRSLNSSRRLNFLSAAGRLLPMTGVALLILSILPAPRALAAVNVTSYSARFQGNQVLVKWETATELLNLGFNILRSTTANGTYTKIAGLIPSQSPGGLVGGSYSYTDSNVTVGQTYYYKLQAVERGGAIQEIGPFSTGPTAGIATATPTKTNTVVPTSALTATATRMTTPTNTPIKTATRTPTAQATAARTPPGIPSGTLPTQVAIGPKLPGGNPPSGDVADATPQAAPQSADQGTLITTSPSPAADALEESAGETTAEDQGSGSVPSGADLRPLVSVLFFGLAGIFGLGSLVFGVLGLILFARVNSRR